MNTKIDLKDLSFLIPIRIDSIDRLENLEIVLDFIISNFATNIHILEAAPLNNKYLSKLFPEIDRITFIEDHNPVFYRTKYINKLVSESTTTFVAVWDADVLVAKNQIVKSMQLLREKEADFVLPYEKNLLDTSKIIRDLYYQERNINMLKNNSAKMKKMYPPVAVGGGFMANRNSYIESGIENLNFYGWGLEDGERVCRWKILEYNMKRIPGDMYHLTHQRGINSMYQSKYQMHSRNLEYWKIASMTKEELQKHVESWK